MSIENSMESTPASWKLQTWIFSSPHSHTCRRIVVAHIWSCDTERRNSKYRLRFLAVAADNLGLNRRQLSASVAWHPVLGGVLVFHLLLYITMFFIYFASDSQHTKDAFQDCPPPLNSPPVGESAMNVCYHIHQHIMLWKTWKPWKIHSFFFCLWPYWM